MDKPFGKASGRTFYRINTLVPDPYWNSLQVLSSVSLKPPNEPPSEALKSGLPMPVFATGGLTHSHQKEKPHSLPIVIPRIDILYNTS
jgi:hypothetical protein